MKTVTYEEFIKFEPCWLEDEKQAEQLKRYFKAKPNMSALDILALDDIDDFDKLQSVLREELIPTETLHLFGCRCAHRALCATPWTGNPHTQCMKLIGAKYKWLDNEITDKELKIALDVVFSIIADNKLTHIEWQAYWATIASADQCAVYAATLSSTLALGTAVLQVDSDDDDSDLLVAELVTQETNWLTDTLTHMLKIN